MYKIISLNPARCLWSLVLLLGLALNPICSKAAEDKNNIENTKKLDVPTEPVVLVVTGNIQKTNVGAAAHFDMNMIEKLPKRTIYTHTLVTDGLRRFDGVWMRDVLDLLEPTEKTTTLAARALNDYVVNIPLTDFYDYDVLLATHMDGVQLQPSDKGPLWIVYPRDSLRKLQDIRYDYRWVWQLNHLDLR